MVDIDRCEPLYTNIYVHNIFSATSNVKYLCKAIYGIYWY